jgi:NDP-sugar pyrophosphorylase family protein
MPPSVTTLILGGELPGDLKRLDPSTAAMMLPVVNRPLVHHTLDLLARAGVEQVHISQRESPLQVRRHVGHGGRWGLQVSYSAVHPSTGCIEVLRRVPNLSAELTILWPAEVLAAFDLKTAISEHLASGYQITSLMVPGAGPARRLDGGNIMLLSRGVVQQLIDERREVASLTELRLRSVTGRISRVAGVRDLHRVNQEVLSGRYRGPRGGAAFGVMIPGREISSGIWVEHNTHISSRADLQPPLVIGENCVVRSGGHLRGAVIGGGSFLGKEVSLNRVVLMPKTIIGHGVNLNECLASSAGILHLGEDVLPSSEVLSVYDTRVRALPGRLLEMILVTAALLLTSPLLLVMMLISRIVEGRALRTRVVVIGQSASGKWKVARIRQLGPPWPAWPLMRDLPALVDVLAGRLRLFGARPLTRDQAKRLNPGLTSRRFARSPGLLDLGRHHRRSVPHQLAVDSYYAACSQLYGKPSTALRALRCRLRGGLR